MDIINLNKCGCVQNIFLNDVNRFISTFFITSTFSNYMDFVNHRKKKFQYWKKEVSEVFTADLHKAFQLHEYM